MAVERIEATVVCDGCGQRFMVDIEPSKELTKTVTLGGEHEIKVPPPYADMEELATDAVNAGDWHEIIVRGQRTIARETTGDGSCSVQAGLCLCHECTRAVDAVDFKDKDGNERKPTEAEIRIAIDATRRPNVVVRPR